MFLDLYKQSGITGKFMSFFGPTSAYNLQMQFSKYWTAREPKLTGVWVSTSSQPGL